MGRMIGGVVVGYLTMFVLVFGSFTAAYLAMGADVAFQTGTYEPSTLWLVVSWVLGFLAALAEAGGGVCLILGFAFRPACLMMAFTMGVATLHHFTRGDSLQTASHAIEAGIVFVSLLFIGPGRYSVDGK